MQSFQITGGAGLQIEDRLTAPEDPGHGSQMDGGLAYAYYFLGMGEQWADEHLGHHKALSYSVVWRCVMWISQTIASLGWGIFEKQGRNLVQIQPSADMTAWMLDREANPEVNAFNWRQTSLAEALLCGNSYSELEYDGFGRLRNKWWIDSCRVCPDRDSRGNLIYEVENGSGVKNTILLPDQIFHLKGPGPDGIVGYSVLELARKSIKLGLSQEAFGLSFFSRGPMPGGILKLQGNPTKEAKNEQRESFERVYGGQKNVGRVIVLSGGNEFTPLTMPNKDAEFIASREFGLEEICRWFGVPPHKVSDLRRSTFSNIEQQAIEAVQDCLLPWCRRLESEADVKLFGRVHSNKRYTRLNLNSLLRGDSVAQTTSVVQKVNAGLMTPDEGREYFDLNPYPDGVGDEPIVQGAMITLDSAVNPPEPVAPAPPVPATDPNSAAPDPNAPPPDNVAATFGTLLRDAYSRLLRVEADKAKRADGRGGLKAWTREYFNGDSLGRVTETLLPIVQAYLLAVRGDVGKSRDIAGLLADLHNSDSLAELQGKGTSGIGEWETVRAESQAADHINRIWKVVNNGVHR